MIKIHNLRIPNSRRSLVSKPQLLIWKTIDRFRKKKTLIWQRHRIGKLPHSAIAIPIPAIRLTIRPDRRYRMHRLRGAEYGASEIKLQSIAVIKNLKKKGIYIHEKRVADTH